MKTGMDGKGFFSRGGAERDKAKNLRGGVGQGSSKSAMRGGAHNAYNSWLKSYVTSEETFICIALSEDSQISSTFMIRNRNYDHNNWSVLYYGFPKERLESVTFF